MTKAVESQKAEKNIYKYWWAKLGPIRFEWNLRTFWAKWWMIYYEILHDIMWCRLLCWYVVHIYFYIIGGVLGKFFWIPRKIFQGTAKRYRQTSMMTHCNLCESIHFMVLNKVLQYIFAKVSIKGEIVM